MAEEVTREEYLSSVFATMVMQLTQMAAMFMGKVPNPENNKMVVDLDAAQIFIDQLEMLEAKTKGNLSAEEQKILKQGLTMVRMAFVEAVESAQKQATKPAPAPSTESPPTAPSSPGTPPTGDEGDPRKKFTKKY
jgi:hypothetical protein